MSLSWQNRSTDQQCNFNYVRNISHGEEYASYHIKSAFGTHRSCNLHNFGDSEWQAQLLLPGNQKICAWYRQKTGVHSESRLPADDRQRYRHCCHIIFPTAHTFWWTQPDSCHAPAWKSGKTKTQREQQQNEFAVNHCGTGANHYKNKEFNHTWLNSWEFVNGGGRTNLTYDISTLKMAKLFQVWWWFYFREIFTQILAQAENFGRLFIFL